MPTPSFEGVHAYDTAPIAKTADYSVLQTDHGRIFSTRGAGASVSFTLPSVTNLPSGFTVTFYCASASGMVIASNGSSDNIVVLNDTGADTITCSTTSRMIGANVKLIWDGVGWLTFEGAGATYATA